MAIISIWIPIIVSVLAVLWIISPLSKFFIGWRDETIALIIAVGSWLVYIAGLTLENVITKILSGDLLTITYVGIIGVIIAVLVKKRGNK